MQSAGARGGRLRRPNQLLSHSPGRTRPRSTTSASWKILTGNAALVSIAPGPEEPAGVRRDKRPRRVLGGRMLPPTAPHLTMAIARAWRLASTAATAGKDACLER